MEQLLSIKDLCNIFGRHRSNIWQWQQKKILPPAIMRNGRTIGWKESDITKFIEDNPWAKYTKITGKLGTPKH